MAPSHLPIDLGKPIGFTVVVPHWMVNFRFVHEETKGDSSDGSFTPCSDVRKGPMDSILRSTYLDAGNMTIRPTWDWIT